MTIIYVDSAYAGSEGAASGDLGFGTGIIFSTIPLAYAASVTGDYLYLRDDRVFKPTSGKFCGAAGVTGKRLIFNRYGNGVDLPFIDGSFYEDSTSGWSHVGGGVWQKTIGTGGTWTQIETMWIGATRPGTDYSSWVPGTMYRMANGNYASGFVNGNDPLSGNGIWYGWVSGGDFIVQVWTGSASVNPIVTYGGLRFLAGSGSAGGVAIGLAFSGSGASDSEVHDIAMFGFYNCAAGSVVSSGTTPNNILYDSVQMLGSKRGMFLQSTVADQYVTNFELSGEWAYRDLIDPVTAPVYTDASASDHKNWEAVACDDRSQDVVVSNGTIEVACGHGVFSIVPSHGGADGTQQRPQRINIDGTIAKCDIRARYARSLAVVNTDDVRISRCKFTGFSVTAKILGNRSVFTQNEWSYAGASPVNRNNEVALVGLPMSQDDGTTLVKFSNNLLDARGRVARGCTRAWSTFQFECVDNDPMPAATVTADCNIMLADTGMAAVRILNGPGGGVNDSVNPNQTLRSNWWNTGAASIEAYTRNGSDSAAGTETTIAGYFTTGVTSGNTEKTLDSIATGGGARPMTPMNKVPIDRLPFN